MTFRLSKWQYEEQLRLWRVSKYISQDAWSVIFETVDQLRSQDQESRILVNGKLDTTKIRRARHIYDKNKSTNPSRRNAKGDPSLSKTGQGVPTGFRRLSIETKGANGKWSVYELGFSCDSRLDESPSPSSPYVPGNALSGAGPQVGESSRCLENDENIFLGMGTSLQDPSISNTSAIQDLDVDIVEEMPLSINALQATPLMAPIQSFSPRDLQQSDGINCDLLFSDWTGWTPTDEDQIDWARSLPQLSSPPLPDPYHLLKDLPFKQFMEALAAYGTWTLPNPKNPRLSSLGDQRN
jgi:hypothetical protein